MKTKGLTTAGFVVVWFLALNLGASATDWYVPGNFATIQDAINSSDLLNGDRIIVRPGSRSGAFVTKAVEIKGEDGAIIDGGPVHRSGLIQGFRLGEGSSGATISHLRFAVDFPIMNAARSNDVTVSHCMFVNPIQGISNWGGSGWSITHNEIIDLQTYCGGGIGIFIGDYSGGTNIDNVIAHNKISGTIRVPEGDCGGYSGPGIALLADSRWGSIGAEAIAYNRVIKNNVSLTSDHPSLVLAAGIELSELVDGDQYPPDPAIFENSIGYNDLRGTESQIVLNPPSLDNPVNTISRNLGENRGHGLRPSAFGPGGNDLQTESPGFANPKPMANSVATNLLLELVSQAGTKVTFRATLTRADNGAPIKGKSMAFYEDSLSKGSAKTKAGTGIATKSWKMLSGPHQVYASFGGDAGFSACSSYTVTYTYWPPSKDIKWTLPNPLPPDPVCRYSQFEYQIGSPSGGAGPPYSFQLGTMGGFPPMNVTLCPTSGKLSGKVTSPAGKYPFTICVSDVAAHQNCKETSINVRDCCQGSLSGSWSGTCGSYGVSGGFSMTITANGNVTGSYYGDDSGSISGAVDINGNLTTQGTAGEFEWWGKITCSDSSLSGTGSWSGSAAGFSCAGGWSGSGTTSF